MIGVNYGLISVVAFVVAATIVILAEREPPKPKPVATAHACWGLEDLQRAVENSPSKEIFPSRAPLVARYTYDRNGCAIVRYDDPPSDLLGPPRAP